MPMAPAALRLMRTLTRAAIYHLRRKLYWYNEMLLHVPHAQARALTMEWVRSIDWQWHVRRNVRFEFDEETGETAVRIERASKYMPELLDRATEEWIDALYQEVRQNSGTQYYSLDELAVMGHPYGWATPDAPWRHEGVLGFTDAVINLQTGEYFEGWRKEVRREGDRAIGTVCNIAPHAIFLMEEEGTKFMRPRPILHMSLERARADMGNAIRRGIYRAKQEALAA